VAFSFTSAASQEAGVDWYVAGSATARRDVMTDGHDDRGAEAPGHPPVPPPASPPPPGWHPGWPPPPTWGYPPGWEPVPERAPRRPGRLVALLAAVVLVGGAAGAGIGHLVWAAPSSVTAAARNNTPASRGNGHSPGGGYTFPFGPGGYSGNGSPGNSSPGNSSPGNGGSGTPREGAGGPSDVKGIAAKITPALVDVNTTFGYQGAAGAGTGIVLTSSGEILTNNHVVDGATRIRVTDLGNNKTYSASVVGYDPVHDMAVIQLKGASGLKTASLGDSAASKVGEPVVAVGNAGGKGGTPTSTGGSITALGQSIVANDDLDGTSEHLHGLIQVNADVIAGDSGGSLVDSSGQVIGMDTADEQQFSLKAPASRGYAIPINQALATAQAIEAGQGSADIHIGATAFLGVLISSVPQGSATKGAAVVRAVPGGPVAKAGVTGGDVITSLDGHRVTSSETLSRLMITHHPGDHVTLGWVTATGQARTGTITLASGPPA
jgi:S1-C subfamily serine protease